MSSTKIRSPLTPFDTAFRALPTTRAGESLAKGWERHQKAISTAGQLAEKVQLAAAYSLVGERALPADRPRGPGLPAERPSDSPPKEPRLPLSPARTRRWELPPVASIPSAGAGARTPMRVGVLLTSHGDIDARSELQPYVRLAVLKNGALPAPDWARPLIAAIGWWIERPELLMQYDAIGPTEYHSKSLEQVAAVNAALEDAGIDGQAYLGYNFTTPLIDDALEQMKRDGITHVVVFNKGAQYSLATMAESIEEVKSYFEKQKSDWHPAVTAVRDFNDDPRFLQTLKAAILDDVARELPGVPSEEITVFLTHHGLPMPLIEQRGDNATKDMARLIEALRLELPGFDLRSGFLNDDFIPGIDWTQPDAESMAREIANSTRKHVLLDGRVSFTTHHRATLFDANVEARGIIEASDPAKDVRFLPNFDGDPRLGKLFVTLTREAIAGEGNIEKVPTGE